ncbi:AAA family ATPase [Enterovirga rhinocerotis]|uniref:nucleotide-binding protein n=1 Tax=Enterovirga rhinocerotis TaxID=1339210 RepID=UPI001060B2AC|nr:AAA family ATPase [Enterovirga rhinocerotis]
MKIIAFVTQKGGAGKTTLAASIAVAAAEAGHKVIALDLDPQGSLAAWGETRDAEKPDVDRIPQGRISELPTILEALRREGYTVAILDTAGLESTSGNLAMKAANFALIPARPSRLDLQATMPTIETLMRLEMRERFAFVLNQCPPGRNSRSTEAAAGLAAFGVLAEPTIVQRADHQDAIAAGQGVTEYAPEGRAANEVRQLWRWIERKLKGKSQ